MMAAVYALIATIALFIFQEYDLCVCVCVCVLGEGGHGEMI